MSKELLKRSMNICWLILKERMLINLDDVERLRVAIESELSKSDPDPVCFANESDLKKVTEKIGSCGFISQPTHLTNTNVNGKIPLYAKPPAQQNPLTNDESKSNDNLIAAATDMYTALQACHEAMAYMSDYDIPIMLPEQVKAALDKAEGKTETL